MIGIPAIIGLVIGALAGFFVRKKISEAKIGSAEDQAKKIVEEGEKTAETLKKEALIEAKEKILRDKAESEKEIKERRNEVTRLERRAVAREETLEKKIESYERKEETLNRKIKEQSELVEKTEQLRLEQAAKLEAVAGLSRDEAKAELVSLIETEAKHEAAMRIVEIESQLKEDADKKARSIISLAIQRCASEHVSEATVSVVALPNDDMKGRIIGREGRNIRTIETMTGVDLIIDDTPEAITVSCFDPVRREVARLALEKLISDGRIHPTRIEETVEKARREVDNVIKQSGERATFETGVHGLNPELVKLLGRLRYRTSYGQNVLDHSIEVAHIAGIIADEIGADSTLAKRAGLLHDIGKAMTQEVEGSHVQIGIDIARKYKENRDVIHAIEAHHNDVEPQTVVAMIIQAADAISAARPGARREDLENYLKRLQKLEEIANSFPGVDKSFAIQAGREIRVMVKPEVVNDDQMILTAREIVKKIESSLEYPGQIKINLIRESRAVDYAK
ncbi:MAG: ribonuclease Y [Firmicutes bacterium]|nr:ribonuclease Y [Candidatus Colimorpha enterica]MDD6321984.1 ribonuclease Y [Bacillota bacterium]MDY2907214.1 ribonuclease Y [Eubacteriales bacterium]